MIVACIDSVHLFDLCASQRRSFDLIFSQVARQTDGIPIAVFIERAVHEPDGNIVLMRINVWIIEQFVDRLRVVTRTIELAGGSYLLEFNVAIHIFEICSA